MLNNISSIQSQIVTVKSLIVKCFEESLNSPDVTKQYKYIFHFVMN